MSASQEPAPFTYSRHYDEILREAVYSYWYNVHLREYSDINMHIPCDGKVKENSWKILGKEILGKENISFEEMTVFPF